MLPDRRDIWNNTDPCRCGQPFGDDQSQKDPRQWIEDIVRFALKAYDIGESIPFEDRQNISFDDFLYHTTTLYTDVRLNIKWPTVELRTLDSMPMQFFKTRWDKFVSTLEDVKTV
jgi:glutamate--cysteine ligase